jgi:hypothetical protein
MTSCDFAGADGPTTLRGVAYRLARPPDDGDETDTGRYRMFRAVRAVLARVSLAVPLLLVLDDLQWAAKPTLLLLRHIVRVASPGLLAIGTFRDTDLDRTHPLAGMLADLRREPHVARVQLTGLSETEVKEFVEIAAGDAFDVSIVELTKAIHVETEGNPLFVGQLLRRPIPVASSNATTLVDEPSAGRARHPRRCGADQGRLSLCRRPNDVLGASVAGRSTRPCSPRRAASSRRSSTLAAAAASHRARSRTG